MPYLPGLPPEVIGQILDEIRDSATRTDLSNFSLISRAWCRPAQSLLHSHVSIGKEEKVQLLIQKYTLYPYLRELASSIHLYGWEIRSFSEGLLAFEETIMAEKFEQLMDMFKVGGRCIRDLYIESYAWNEEHSRKILNSFPAVEKLVMHRIDLSMSPEKLVFLVMGMANLTSLSLYSMTWLERPNFEERMARLSLSQCAKRLSHLDICPVNTLPSLLILLSGPAFDWSGLRSLTLGWQDHSDPNSYEAIKGFLSLLGPQVTQLTISTPSSIDDERAMNSALCLRDLISTQVLYHFTSLRRLAFCTYDVNRPFETSHYKNFIGYYHTRTLLKTMRTPSTVEEIEIKILKPPFGSSVPATWHPLRDLIRSSEIFPNLKGEQGLWVINDSGRRAHENTSIR
ncbi:hypothetical protein E1B28_000372 [Marasmius oreades]|uniref:F-box domain-containing protein n=1 Tax=Marasmius oreades TaxID=181124 RepID=A0A9P7V196_9AGAR|nr:uncharacterized protein E1B28_000372 [Marasmius oreades]KAG7098419.1 hypothetical protein E1B28_000372 [Marasmius oreades]